MDHKESGLNWRFVAATFLPHFAISITQGTVGPLAPFIQQDYGISRAQIGSIMSVFFIGMLIMALLAGSIVERSSLKLWLILSPAFSAVMMLLFAGSWSYLQAVFIFLLLGLMYSFVNPATTKAIIVNFPRERRGTPASIKQTGIPAGFLVASVTLPYIAVQYNWKVGVVVVAAFNLAVAACAWLIYVDKGKAPQPVDKGIAFSGIWRDTVELFRNRNFILVSLLQAAFTICQIVMSSYLVLFLVESVHCSVIYAGLVMSVTQFTGMISRVLWGMMSDYVFTGRRVPVLAIIGITTLIGNLGLTMMDANTPAWIIWAVASMAGAGSVGVGGVAILFRAEMAGERLAATSTGLGMVFAALGTVAATPLFGYMVDVSGTYSFAWGFITAITLAGTLLLFFIREEGVRRPAIPVEQGVSQHVYFSGKDS